MTEGKRTWYQGPHKTSTQLPKGATDCHFHVFGPQAIFPYVKNGSYKPADAPKEALFALHKQMRIERGVVVQTNIHGFDNSASADAIAAMPQSYKGVALAPPNVSQDSLTALNSQGFRALRFNYMPHLSPGASPDEIKALAPRLADIGWHLQIHMASSLIEKMSHLFAELPVPVVIDHFGRIDASKGRDQPEFDALLRLMDHDHIWCKVSGVERASREEPPYADAMPFAREIVERFGDRVVWGSDWPHPNYRTDPPDDGDLFDLLPQIAPDASVLRALMVDNPNRLYRFEES